MVASLEKLVVRDGARLVHRQWPANGSEPLTVLVVHGLGEHSGRYEHVGDALARAGLEVHGYDQRGFGESEGTRADIPAWSIVHDDLEDVVRVVRSAAPERPLALYGHSLGGLIALGYVLSHRAPVDLLVLSAPAIDDDLARWKHVASPLAARFVPMVRMPNGISIDQLVGTPRSGLRYREDPLVLWQSTIRYGALGFAEQERVRGAVDRLQRMPVPTYVARGTDDPIVPVRAFERIARLGNVTSRTWPGLRHEIHNESVFESVVGEIGQWLTEHASSMPGHAGAAPR